jgi:pantoate--beta-alanine ligase
MRNSPLSPVTSISALRTRVKTWRSDGLTIGFVPTMGALHEGHLSLVRLARAHCDKVIASIFVNPAQFAPGEDFAAYPRTFLDDAEKLQGEACDMIYAPDDSVMYPDGFVSEVSVGGPAEGLESAARPHFFKGVATVVAKLLNQVRPDIAVFGEKDYQQLLVIRRLARDLDLDVDIMAGPIAREADGLALSSRNAYLGEAAREQAAQLFAILNTCADALKSGAGRADAEAEARAAAAEAFDSVDYIEARDPNSLAPLPDGPLSAPARLLAAVRLGEVRLIDNIAVSPR